MRGEPHRSRSHPILIYITQILSLLVLDKKMAQREGHSSKTVPDVLFKPSHADRGLRASS